MAGAPAKPAGHFTIGRARLWSRNCAPSNPRFRNRRSPGSGWRSRKQSAKWRPTRPASRERNRDLSHAAGRAAAAGASATIPHKLRLLRRRRRRAQVRQRANRRRGGGPDRRCQGMSRIAGRRTDRRPAAPLTARSRLLNARSTTLTQEGLRGFRDVVNEVDDLGAATAKAAKSARDTRDSYGPGSAQRMPRADELTPPHSLHDEFEPQLDADDMPGSDYEGMQLRSDETLDDMDDEGPALPPRSSRPQPPRGTEAEEGYEQPRPPAFLSRHGQTCRGADHSARARHYDFLAMVRHNGGLPVHRSSRIATAEPDSADAGVAAQIPWSGAAGGRSGKRPVRRRAARPRRRSPNASSSMKRTPTTRRASALSAPPSGARKPSRRAPDWRQSSPCAQTSRFPTGG